MSRSTITPRKSSPCCIGCIVLLIIVIGFTAALGIYVYKFAKDNMTMVDVAAKVDPELNAEPEEIMPASVGDFSRISLQDNMDTVPVKYWGDQETSGVQVGVYEDAEKNSVTVIAMLSDDARDQRQMGGGPLTMGRMPANSPDMAVSIRDPFGDEPNTVVVWVKPNWTFMVQTTSTRAIDFVEAFNPGGAVGATESTPTQAEPAADPELSPVVDPAVESTPVPGQKSAPVQEPAPPAILDEPLPDATVPESDSPNSVQELTPEDPETTSAL